MRTRQNGLQAANHGFFCPTLAFLIQAISSSSFFICQWKMVFRLPEYHFEVFRQPERKDD